MSTKVSREASRARKARFSIRADELIDRLQDYALGDPAEDLMTKGQLDAAKFLLDRVVPHYREPVFAPDQKALAGPNRVFVLAWDGGSDAALVLAQRAQEALPPPIEGTFDETPHTG
jgi:hypothetical protein